jgi:hypothetical protein
MFGKVFFARKLLADMYAGSGKKSHKAFSIQERIKPGNYSKHTGIISSIENCKETG